MFFRTVPPANTLVRWVNENAFVSEVQTRPCPTLGRPVHLGLSPSITARYFSPCPSDSTSRWTPCPPELQSGGCRFALAVSGFRFRARLGFSIPSAFSGPRGITPAFGYGTPHSSARGTSTLLSNALLSSHYGPDPSPWCLCQHFPLTVIAGISSTRFLRRAPRASPVSTSSFTPCRR